MESLMSRSIVSLVLSCVIAARSFRRKSVDLSGVFAGIPVMVFHAIAGYRYAGMLLVFFATSSKLTKVGQDKKRDIDAEFKEGGQRNWKQVLANSAVATILAILITIKTGGKDTCLDTQGSMVVTGLIGSMIGHYACCNGDTWSSEIGMLSKAQPRLITTFKSVRKGTNGAVSREGLLGAAAAGFVIGLTYILIGQLTAECNVDIVWRQLLVLPIATAAGLFGSLVDSILGATLQFSGFCNARKKVVGKPGPTVTKISGMNVLDNNGVNVLAALLTALVTSLACTYIF